MPPPRPDRATIEAQIAAQKQQALRLKKAGDTKGAVVAMTKLKALQAQLGGAATPAAAPAAAPRAPAARRAGPEPTKMSAEDVEKVTATDEDMNDPELMADLLAMTGGVAPAAPAPAPAPSAAARRAQLERQAAELKREALQAKSVGNLKLATAKMREMKAAQERLAALPPAAAPAARAAPNKPAARSAVDVADVDKVTATDEDLNDPELLASLADITGGAAPAAPTRAQLERQAAELKREAIQAKSAGNLKLATAKMQEMKAAQELLAALPPAAAPAARTAPVAPARQPTATSDEECHLSSDDADDEIERLRQSMSDAAAAPKRPPRAAAAGADGDDDELRGLMESMGAAAAPKPAPGAAAGAADEGVADPDLLRLMSAMDVGESAAEKPRQSAEDDGALDALVQSMSKSEAELEAEAEAEAAAEREAAAEAAATAAMVAEAAAAVQAAEQAARAQAQQQTAPPPAAPPGPAKPKPQPKPAPASPGAPDGVPAAKQREINQLKLEAAALSKKGDKVGAVKLLRRMKAMEAEAAAEAAAAAEHAGKLTEIQALKDDAVELNKRGQKAEALAKYRQAKGLQAALDAAEASQNARSSRDQSEAAAPQESAAQPLTPSRQHSELSLNELELELRRVELGDGTASEGTKVYAVFSWELPDGLPPSVTTEPVPLDRARRAEWAHRAALSFDRTKRASLSFFHKRGCVVDVYSKPGGFTKFFGAEDSFVGRGEVKLDGLCSSAELVANVPLRPVCEDGTLDKAAPSLGFAKVSFRLRKPFAELELSGRKQRELDKARAADGAADGAARASGRERGESSAAAHGGGGGDAAGPCKPKPIEEDDVEFCERIVSDAVLEYELKQLAEAGEKLRAAGTIVPMANADREQALTFKRDMLKMNVECGVLTVEAYLQQLREAIPREKARSAEFKAKPGGAYIAVSAYKHALLMQKELEAMDAT